MAHARLLLVSLIAIFAVLWVSCGLHTHPARGARPSPPRVLSAELLPLRSVARIPGGTLVGDRVPEGWTHVLLTVHPRFGAGDVSSLPNAAAHYARLFQFTILARTRRDSTPTRIQYALDRVAIGYAVDVGERKVILTRGNTQGAKLDFIGRQVFEKNDEKLEELSDVGRSDTATVFDAPAIVLREGVHRQMIYRHLVRIDPDSGEVTFLVWLLEPSTTGDYVPVDDAVLVPPGLQEDRVLSVKREKISLLGLPAPDTLALVGLPREGERVRFTPGLREAAGRRRYSPATMVQLDAAVRAALVSPTR